MRPFSFLPKSLRWLLLANAFVFGIAFIFGSIFGLNINLPGYGEANVRDYISYFLAFWPFEPLQIWRFVTYMFVHIDFWHFFFNMLMLWMFGSEIADVMGDKHFIAMYFFCGIFAAIFSLLMFVLGLTNNPIIGASGALMGIFVAYYKFFPDRMLLLFFFFPVKIKYAMWIMVALDVFMAPSGDGVAHLAHLGGVVGGFLYMYLYNSGCENLFNNMKRKFKTHTPKFTVHEGGRSKRSAPLEGEVFYVDENKRMDEILKKVKREGINSLDESERKFLLQASERMKNSRF